MVVMKNIDHLPENLIVEILSWLPVKDLLQFKSICKSRYSIISSPRFITKHLKNYYTNNNNNNNSWKDCLLVQYYVSHAELQLYESKSLGIYDNSLAFLSVHETNKKFDVWTWNNEECWIKKLSVEPFPQVRNPVGHWKDNRLLLECKEGKLVLYDPETQEKRDLAFRKDMWCEGAFAYMEGLVSIKENMESLVSIKENAQ